LTFFILPVKDFILRLLTSRVIWQSVRILLYN
jgi:hypothetical protein